MGSNPGRTYSFPEVEVTQNQVKVIPGYVEVIPGHVEEFPGEVKVIQGYRKNGRATRELAQAM